MAKIKRELPDWVGKSLSLGCGLPATKKSDEIILKLHLLAYSDGAWFRFPKFLMGCDLSFGEIILLAWLIGHEDRIRKSLKKKNKKFPGWCYCKTTTIEKDIQLNRSAQDRLFRGLIEKDYIATKRKGVPPKRFVVLNHALLIKKETQE